MLTLGSFEKARRYIEAHSVKDSNRKYEVHPCITLSRETGAGADVIGNMLIKYFNEHKKDDSPDWTIFDKNLIQKVLEDYHLPSYLDKMFENKNSAVNSLISETLTGQPGTWTLASKTIHTILKLGQTGNVIIVGRGANFVHEKLKNSFHVRLVADYEDRVKHIEEVYQLNRKDAEHFIKKDDEERKNFVEKNFRKKIDDPLYYHLIINTSLVSYNDAAKIIRKQVNKKIEQTLSNIQKEETI